MNSDIPAGHPKRKPTLIRVAIVLVVLAIVALPVLGKKHNALIKTCNLAPGDPKDALAACDFLLDWTAYEPSTRSLIYRHKMRVYMAQQDSEAALRAADLAIAADPESIVPWQWKALVLARAEDYPEAMVAIEAALKLAPGNDYSLETKAKLLRSMERFEEIEPLVEDAVANYKVGSWAWSYAGYFRLKADDYKSAALAFAEALRLDPHDAYDRRKFLEACRHAGSDCPQLFPELRKQFENYSCYETYADLDEMNPGFAERVLPGSSFESLTDYFEKGSQLAVAFVQFGYFDAARDFEKSDPQKNAARLIVFSRLFDCVADGAFYYADRGYDVEKRRNSEQQLYGPELRRNLVDLAHVYLAGLDSSQ